MASDWKPPEGYTLTVIPSHTIDDRGMNRDGADPRRPARALMPDGAQQVAWFNEAEPFVWQENNGRGIDASPEAIAAAAAGKPMAGWNPNVEHRDIVGGYVPAQYVLTWDDDPTPVTEPASAQARELTPDEEIARLNASIDAAKARISEIKGASS